MTKIVPLANVTDCPDLVRLAGLRGGAISIGNFDGVHLGHAALLKQLRQVADSVGGPAVVVALDPHPAVILRPEQAPTRLTWIERRAELMQPHGIDALVVCETRGGLLGLTANEFFEALIRQQLDARAIVEGPNFFFGKGREGDIATLGRLCVADSIELQIALPSNLRGEMISSTRIRRCLTSGDLDGATAMLGTFYRMRGDVVQGAGRGRTIGFPTANLQSIDTVVPAAGVYGGRVEVNKRRQLAAIHIGPNPTFDQDTSMKVEVHIIDYDGDLYDQSLNVDFALRVRDVIKFDSATELVEQLESDIRTIRNQLA
ncbi:Riboflavin kinase [Rubripirellula tenax]|uniref:Riboflavin biosynthesis protein n=1 Tax=Rubripirellula tenax TaxID=2528015 RepID=A0A5C6FGT4_9BACT|nr:riboflavin biosynthesis protein RibF [Rubripirellula tenax]TWU59384.1 Riboflavin kinase [Rubripirellula tenax]